MSTGFKTWSVPWPWKGHPEQTTQMIRKAEYCQHKGEKNRCDAYSFMSPMGQQKTGIIADPKQSPGECHSSMAEWMSRHYKQKQTAFAH